MSFRLSMAQGCSFFLGLLLAIVAQSMAQSVRGASSSVMDLGANVTGTFPPPSDQSAIIAFGSALLMPVVMLIWMMRAKTHGWCGACCLIGTIIMIWFVVAAWISPFSYDLSYWEESAQEIADGFSGEKHDGAARMLAESNVTGTFPPPSDQSAIIAFSSALLMPVVMLIWMMRAKTHGWCGACCLIGTIIMIWFVVAAWISPFSYDLSYWEESAQEIADGFSGEKHDGAARMLAESNVTGTFPPPSDQSAIIAFGSALLMPVVMLIWMMRAKTHGWCGACCLIGTIIMIWFVVAAWISPFSYDLSYWEESAQEIADGFSGKKST